MLPVKVHDVEGSPPDSYLKNVRIVSAGRSGRSSLALDNEGYVYAWGDNYYGMLGNGESKGYELEPVEVLSGKQDPDNSTTLLQNIVDIDFGIYHAATVTYNPPGYVYTWGVNKNGELGIGTTSEFEDEPVWVDLENIVDVAVVNGEPIPYPYPSELKGACLALESIEDGGYVWAWGSDKYGKLGTAGIINVDELVPVAVSGGDGTGQLGNIIAIAGGWNFCMALDADGYVWAWGRNNKGQVGQLSGADDTILYPHKVVKDNDGSPLSDIVYIDAGGDYGLAVDKHGRVWVWGSNSTPISQRLVGKLGLGNNYRENFYYGARLMQLKAPNDDCANATVMLSLTGKEYCGSTVLSDDGSVWFSYTPDYSGNQQYMWVTLEYSSFDTIVRVYNECGDETWLAENDNELGGGTWSEIRSLIADSEEDFLIEVSGKNGERGNYVLKVDMEFN